MNVEGASSFGEAHRAAKRSREARGEKKRRVTEAESPERSDVRGFGVSADCAEKLTQLRKRMLLRDPCHFEVELYPGYWADGVVEVLENALRSLAKKERGKKSFLDRLVALSVFVAEVGVRCSLELPQNGEKIFSSLLGVLAVAWRVALSRAETEREKKRLLREAEVLREAMENGDLTFDLACDEEAVWESVFLRNSVISYLQSEYAHLRSEEETFRIANQMVITEDAVAALKTPASPAAISAARPTPPRVKTILRNLR